MEKSITFTLNGKSTTTTVQTHEMAQDVLWRELNLKSVRVTCGIGICGACTILVDGEVISACLYLAPMMDGKTIDTVEGFGTPEDLDPVQQAYLEKMGFQCSYCTPGMIVTTRALLTENPNPDTHEIKEYLAGNLCRCGSYVKIIESVKRAAELTSQSEES